MFDTRRLEGRVRGQCGMVARQQRVRPAHTHLCQEQKTDSPSQAGPCNPQSAQPFLCLRLADCGPRQNFSGGRCVSQPGTPFEQSSVDEGPTVEEMWALLKIPSFLFACADVQTRIVFEPRPASTRKILTRRGISRSWQSRVPYLHNTRSCNDAQRCSGVRQVAPAGTLALCRRCLAWSQGVEMSRVSWVGARVSLGRVSTAV